jgi:hypothetical protein
MPWSVQSLQLIPSSSLCVFFSRFATKLNRIALMALLWGCHVILHRPGFNIPSVVSPGIAVYLSFLILDWVAGWWLLHN